MRKERMKTYLSDINYKPDIGIAISERSYTSGDICPRHRHNYFELELLTTGSGINIINNHQYELSSGSLYLIRPSDFHAVELECGSSLINISFNEAVIDSKLLDQLTVFGGDLIFNAHSNFFEHLMCAMSDEFSHHVPDRRILRGLLESLLLRLIQLCGNLNENNSSKPSFEAALSYLQLHFYENPTLSDTARAAHYNPSHFSSLFHSRMQVTYSDYLNTLRVNCAKRMLLMTDLRISEIGHQSGFGSQTNFQRVFREKTGVTPLKFRNSGRRPD